MKKVILDTNFIMTCIRQKIDFFEELKFMGLQILIPKQVKNELEKVAKSKKKLRFRNEAELALRMMESHSHFEVDLKEHNKKRGVDKLLTDYANKNKSVMLATLDKELRDNTENNNVVIRDKKKLEVI